MHIFNVQLKKVFTFCLYSVFRITMLMITYIDHKMIKQLSVANSIESPSSYVFLSLMHLLLQIKHISFKICRCSARLTGNTAGDFILL